MSGTLARRELATRNRSWAHFLAALLLRAGATPNAISATSVVVACGAGVAFAVAPSLSPAGQAVALLLAAAGIQLRLLCNMLDGMLAVEGGLKSRTGDIFNEVPDRLADVVILVGAGYGLREVAYGPLLGWLAAVLAVLTAYVRVLSGSLGLPQHFLGPMAKQHRMFALTLTAICAAAESLWQLPPRALAVGLGVIVAGTALTLWRRLHRLLLEADAR